MTKESERRMIEDDIDNLVERARAFSGVTDVLYPETPGLPFTAWQTKNYRAVVTRWRENNPMCPVLIFERRNGTDAMGAAIWTTFEGDSYHIVNALTELTRKDLDGPRARELKKLEDLEDDIPE